MNKLEYLLAVQADPERTFSVGDMSEIIAEFTQDGRVPRQACSHLADALNRERPGAGVWDVLPVGHGVRTILRPIKRIAG